VEPDGVSSVQPPVKVAAWCSIDPSVREAVTERDRYLARAVGCLPAAFVEQLVYRCPGVFGVQVLGFATRVTSMRWRRRRDGYWWPDRRGHTAAAVCAILEGISRPDEGIIPGLAYRTPRPELLVTVGEVWAVAPHAEPGLWELRSPLDYAEAAHVHCLDGLTETSQAALWLVGIEAMRKAARGLDATPPDVYRGLRVDSCRASTLRDEARHPELRGPALPMPGR
jgi:hypothetical protein